MGSSARCEPSGPTAIISWNTTMVPGTTNAFMALCISGDNSFPVTFAVKTSALGLAINKEKRVTLNLASNSNASSFANIASCARIFAALVVPPPLPANCALGSGIRFTRNSVEPKVVNLALAPSPTVPDTIPLRYNVRLYLLMYHH